MCNKETRESMRIDTKEFAQKLIEYMDQPENYWVLHFAAQYNLTQEKLDELCETDPDVRDAVKLAMTVQEYKLLHMAATGMMKEGTMLKALETKHGWKESSVGNIVNVHQRYLMEANERVNKIRNESSEG